MAVSQCGGGRVTTRPATVEGSAAASALTKCPAQRGAAVPLRSVLDGGLRRYGAYYGSAYVCYAAACCVTPLFACWCLQALCFLSCARKHPQALISRGARLENAESAESAKSAKRLSGRHPEVLPKHRTGSGVGNEAKGCDGRGGRGRPGA